MADDFAQWNRQLPTTAVGAGSQFFIILPAAHCARRERRIAIAFLTAQTLTRAC
jgi:hypothetical protein